MKNVKIGLIIVLSVLVVGLAAGLCFALRNGGADYHWGYGSYELKNTREIDVTDVSALKLDYTGTGYDIHILQADGDKVVLEEYFNFEETAFAAVRTENGVLDISKEAENQIFGWNNRQGYIDLYVPESLFDRLTDLEIESTSGNVRAQEVLLRADTAKITATSGNLNLAELEGDFTVKATSGNIRVGNCDGNLTVSTTSGNKTVESCSGNLESRSGSGNTRIKASSGDLTALATSGDITVESCEGGCEISASSGNVRVLELSGKAAVQTTSGNIWVEVTELSGNIALNGSSGNATLILPEDSEFLFSAATSSGDIRTLFDEDLSYNRKGNQAQGSVGDNPVFEIECNFTSGNVNVKSA